MKPAMFVLLLAYGVIAHAEAPVASSPARPYYDCMIEQLSIYGKRTDRVDDAIAAAQSKCSAEHSALSAALEKTWADIAPSYSPERRRELADTTLRKLEARMRGDFAAAVLDAQ